MGTRRGAFLVRPQQALELDVHVAVVRARLDPKCGKTTIEELEARTRLSAQASYKMQCDDGRAQGRGASLLKSAAALLESASNSADAHG
eukprot:3311745-Pleurochrysis_carterae.AAC.3